MLYVISETEKSAQSNLIHRFANWQLWPLAVTVLRTGLIFTKGHPFQVAVQLPSVFIGVSDFWLLAGNVSN